jgi:uncharacterized protein
MMARATTALCVAWLLTVGLSAQASQPPFPQLTAPVNDTAQVIDAASAGELDRIIRSLQTATGDVIVVATVPTIGSYGSIEEYALRLFESAGIGTRTNDNGLLVVVAVNDRKVRIEVGYGLEEFITDGYAGEVIRTRLLPAFREGNYGSGLVAGVRQIALRLAERRGATLSDLPAAPEPPRPQRNRQSSGTARAIITMLFVFFLIMAANRNNGGPGVRRRGRHGMWSGWYGGVGGFGGGFGSGGFRGGGFGGGGFGGGGFGGFGGGRSGGGGASGGW